MSHFVAQTIDDLPDLSELLNRSGLEFMQDMVSGRLAGPPIGNTLGFKPVFAEHGKVVFVGSAGFGSLNPMRGVHGGWYGAILDSCMGCAVMTLLEKGQIYTTLEYKVNITRALTLDTPVEAIGVIDHAGRRTAVASGELRGKSDGKIYAKATTTCLIIRKE